MSHEIAFIDGQYSFARAEGTDAAWHKLGQVILPTDDRATKLRKAGLLYTVEKAPMYYRPACDKPADGQPAPKARQYSDRVAQYRSDTGADLGIVSPTFQTVQPAEALDFFEVWAKEGGATIETLFALHGGRVYGGLAAIGKAVAIEGDVLKPYVYWSTACDGTRNTKIKNTAIRVVCANTDAMTRGDKAQYSLSHRSKYDPKAAREHVEKALEQFGAYCQMVRSLARVKVDSVKAAGLTEVLVGPAKTPKGRESTAFASIMALFQGSAKGSDLVTAKGTAWGYLNAVTDYVDHHARATSSDNRFDSAQDGIGDDLKGKARDLVTTI